MTYRIILFDPNEENSSQEINLLEFDAKDRNGALRQFENFKTSFRKDSMFFDDADDLELYRIDVKEKNTKIV